jgi:hypothetical protein
MRMPPFGKIKTQFPGLFYLSASFMATASGKAMLQGDSLAVGSDAILSVGAPVNAAAGLGDVEVTSRVDEHLLAAEKAAVVLTCNLGSVIVGQHLVYSSL